MTINQEKSPYRPVTVTFDTADEWEAFILIMDDYVDARWPKPSQEVATQISNWASNHYGETNDS